MGRIVEENDSAAIGAAVVLLNPSDSSLIKGATTNTRGVFKIDNISAADYLLKVVYLGYADHYKKISVNDNLRLGKIKLQVGAKNLKEVEVATSALMATQQGDTTSYNSNAFKTNKDATAEELLTKMPGITIVDGKIQAQGEQVKQVLVDGKPFFGEDPNAVLKNLPAEIIDKVQVFDRRSDQAQFTGFDDGNNSKTINITTKLQFRNGVFGRVYAGPGYEEKYKGGAVLNSFKEKRRVTFMAMSNNINEQNFSSEDLLGVVASSGGGNNNRGGGFSQRGGGGGPGGGRFGPQNSADNFLVDVRNGITTTHAFGTNYSDEWGKNITVSASYFFNYTQNYAESNILRQYVVGNNNGLNYYDTSLAKSNNLNNRFNGRLEWKIDSFNSVILQPRISFQSNTGSSGSSGYNLKNILISDLKNNYATNLQAYNASIPLLYRRSFVKKGRTLSLNLNPTLSGNNGNSNLLAVNNYFKDTLLLSDTTDQRAFLQKSGFSNFGNITFTEAFGKNHFVSVNYTNNYQLNKSDKEAFSRKPLSDDYTIKDSLVSNAFDNTYVANSAGLSYRYQEEKYNFSIGLNAQEARLSKTQYFPGSYQNTRVFSSLLPNAMFMYKFTQKDNLRVFYRSFNNAPSIDQLQDVLNNSNTLQLSMGNPALRQTFQHNLNMRYSGVNTQKNTSLFILLGGTYTNDYIGNRTTIAQQDTVVFGKILLPRGSQLSMPENFNNYYTVRFFINYSFPMKGIKSNFNINSGLNYSNIPAKINDKINYSKTTAPNLGLVLSSNISERVDFTLSSNTSYNMVINSLQSNLNTSFLNQQSKLRLNVMPTKKLVLNAEYNHQLNTGLTNTFNQNISLFNAAIAYKLFKDNAGELRLFVFDVLNQNRSIQRNVTDTYIEDARTTILQRYFMLTFTYNFKKYFSKNSKEQEATEKKKAE